MYNNKRFLAIIPARSGSKGLPDKNIRVLMGKPLIAHTIQAALSTDLMDDVIVSTDSEEYAKIAKRYGAEIPFLRPKEIACDTSLASEYIIYTIETLKSAGRIYDYFVLLQPTSPLRKPEHIIEGIRMITEQNLTSVVAFSESEHPVEYYHRLPPDMNLGMLSMRESNRQEHETCYRINGMLFISDCETYMNTHSFYGANGKALIIDRLYAVDIDNSFDFELADFILKRGE